MSISKFSVSGLDSLINSLSAVCTNVNKVVEEGLLKGAMLIQNSAKYHCPVDTGALRNSIVITPIESGFDIGSILEYAEAVEYGTGSLGDPSVSHTTKEKWVYYNPLTKEYKTAYPQKPRPFMYPALQENKLNVEICVKESIVKRLKEAVK